LPEPLNADLCAYEAEGDALRAWRNRTPTERMESLFMMQLSMIRKLDGHTLRLNDLNDSDRKVKKAVDDHLRDHHEQEIQIKLVKKMGGWGTAFLAGLIALSTSILTIDGRIWGWFIQ